MSSDPEISGNLSKQERGESHLGGEGEREPTSSLTVPSELVGPVRAGTYEELNVALKEASALIEELDSENRARREQLESLFGRVDSGRELLGVVGLAAGRDTPIEIDIRAHGPVFMHSLLARIKFEQGRLKALDRADPGRDEARARIDRLEDLLLRAEQLEGQITSTPPGRDLLTLAVDATQEDPPRRSSQESEGV